MAEIASRWSAIIDEAGPDAILNAHYTGTCSVIAYAFGSRFFRRLGATEVDPDSVCNKAGHVALDYMYGSSVTGFDPRSARDAGCIMVWGANPSASAPHAHDHWLPGGPGHGDRDRLDPHADGAAGRPAPAAVPRQRRRPGVRDAARDRARRAGRPGAARAPRDRVGRAGAAARSVHAGVGGAGHRRAGAADRAGGRDLRSRAVAALDRSGPAAPVHRRQRDAGGGAAAGRERQPGQARGRVPVPERSRSRSTRTGWRRRSWAIRRSRSATWTWPHASRIRRAAAACSAGTSTSPRPTPSRPGCWPRSAARTCSRWWSTCSRPTRATTPTCCCRRPASWSSTTWSRRTSICRCRHR